MKIDFFKRIWNDSVSSKVIAVIIVAIGTTAFNFIQSLLKGISFRRSFVDLWTLNIPLWLVTSILVIVLILVWLFKSYFSVTTKPFLYDDKTLLLDIAIFNRIRNDLLPQDDTIYWLKYFNFAGFSFESEILKQLFEFNYEAKKSDFEFLNPNLEKIKKELEFEINSFMGNIGSNAFTASKERLQVPPEWEFEQPERFKKVVNELHTSSRMICQHYDNLVRTGRQVLKV